MIIVRWGIICTLSVYIWSTFASSLVVAKSAATETVQVVGQEEERLTRTELQTLADDYPGISINPNYAGKYPTASEAREQLEYLTSTLNWTDAQVVAQPKKSVAQDSSKIHIRYIVPVIHLTTCCMEALDMIRTWKWTASTILS